MSTKEGDSELHINENSLKGDSVKDRRPRGSSVLFTTNEGNGGQEPMSEKMVKNHCGWNRFRTLLNSINDEKR